MRHRFCAATAFPSVAPTLRRDGAPFGGHMQLSATDQLRLDQLVEEIDSFFERYEQQQRRDEERREEQRRSCAPLSLLPAFNLS